MQGRRVELRESVSSIGGQLAVLARPLRANTYRMQGRRVKLRESATGGYGYIRSFDKLTSSSWIVRRSSCSIYTAGSINSRCHRAENERELISSADLHAILSVSITRSYPPQRYVIRRSFRRNESRTCCKTVSSPQT
jgi:hypothetical protein